MSLALVVFFFHKIEVFYISKYREEEISESIFKAELLKNALGKEQVLVRSPRSKPSFVSLVLVTVQGREGTAAT